MRTGRYDEQHENGRDLSKVCDAVNVLNSVAWNINKKILDTQVSWLVAVVVGLSGSFFEKLLICQFVSNCCC